MNDFMDDNDAFARHLDQHKWDCIPDEFIVFDLETTGLTPRTDRIVEIGAIRFKKDVYLKTGEVKNFHSFIKQEKAIPKEATAIHGITDDMVIEGDSEYSALTEFFAFVKGLPVYAYNAKFDRDFIKETTKRSGYHDEQFRFEVSDIMDFVDVVIEDLPNRKLETVGKHLGYPTENMHRALEDCTLALAVMIKCLQHQMINDSTMLREQYLDLKKKTEELKVAQNVTSIKDDHSPMIFKVLGGLAVSFIFILMLM